MSTSLNNSPIIGFYTAVSTGRGEEGVGGGGGGGGGGGRGGGMFSCLHVSSMRNDVCICVCIYIYAFTLAAIIIRSGHLSAFILYPSSYIFFTHIHIKVCIFVKVVKDPTSCIYLSSCLSLYEIFQGIQRYDVKCCTYSLPLHTSFIGRNLQDALHPVKLKWRRRYRLFRRHNFISYPADPTGPRDISTGFDRNHEGGTVAGTYLFAMCQ